MVVQEYYWKTGVGPVFEAQCSCAFLAMHTDVLLPRPFTIFFTAWH
jgi:hypothetical protein